MKIVVTRSDLEALVKEHIESKYPDILVEIDWSESSPKSPLKRSPKRLDTSAIESKGEDLKASLGASKEDSEEPPFEPEEETTPKRRLFKRGTSDDD